MTTLVLLHAVAAGALEPVAEALVQVRPFALRQGFVGSVANQHVPKLEGITRRQLAALRAHQLLPDQAKQRLTDVAGSHPAPIRASLMRRTRGPPRSLASRQSALQPATHRCGWRAAPVPTAGSPGDRYRLEPPSARRARRCGLRPRASRASLPCRAGCLRPRPGFASAVGLAGRRRRAGCPRSALVASSARGSRRSIVRFGRLPPQPGRTSSSSARAEADEQDRAVDSEVHDVVQQVQQGRLGPVDVLPDRDQRSVPG